MTAAWSSDRFIYLSVYMWSGPYDVTRLNKLYNYRCRYTKSNPIADHSNNLQKVTEAEFQTIGPLYLHVVWYLLHGVDPLSYFSFQPVLHDWCNKGRGICYPVCGMVHIKEPLLLIDKSSLCGGSGFPFSLSEWSLTICLTPYNRR